MRLLNKQVSFPEIELIEVFWYKMLSLWYTIAYKPCTSNDLCRKSLNKQLNM